MIAGRLLPAQVCDDRCVSVAVVGETIKQHCFDISICNLSIFKNFPKPKTWV